MTKPLILSTLLIFVGLSIISAQRAFPTPQLVDVNQQSVQLSDYVGNGKPTVIAVWATWCQPCHLELDHMKSYLEKWTGEYGAQVLAVSVDKTYQVRKIKPLVARKGWTYDIIIDTDGKLQEELGFRSIPQMYILDGSGNIVREFSGYRNGRESEVDAIVKQLSSK